MAMVIPITWHVLTDAFQCGWHSTSSQSSLVKTLLGTSMTLWQ